MSVSEYILNPKYKKCEINYKNISHYLLEYLLIHKKNDLIIDYLNDITLNGQQIYDLSQVIANSLLNEHHLKSGEIVCFLCPNHYFQAIGLISVLSAGAIGLILSDGSTYDEIENIYKKTNFKFLFCGKDNEQIGAKLSNNYSEIKKVFIVAENSYKSENNFLNIEKLINYEIKTNERIAIDRNQSDIALIEMTFGTNDGIRKPVIKTHLNLIHAIHQMHNKDILSNNVEDIVLSIPLDKLFGISFFFNSLISGSKYVIIKGSFETSFNLYLESIGKLKISKLILFSTNINLMVKNEVNLLYNISSVKEMVHIGVFDDYNIFRHRVENMFKLRYFRSVYGTTESGVISCLFRSKSFERNCYSSGQLVPGNQLKVIDIRTGESLPAHRTGQICVKSGQLCSGYLTGDKVEENPDIFTEDGYFKTSDAGYYDSFGNIYVESRVLDNICIEDQILSPNELKILLLSHPDVIDATVVGIYCEDIEENSDNSCDKTSIHFNNSFKIFAVLSIGSNTSDLDLINFINERVEPIRQIDSRIFIVDVLPRNSTGIITRSALIKY